MTLQTLLFPKKGICEERELFVRETEKELSFDTYFNMFSLKNWNAYTRLETLILELEAEGDFSVELWDEQGRLEKHDFSMKKRNMLRIPFPCRRQSRLLYFRFCKETDNAWLYGGRYLTETGESNAPDSKIRMAVAICTYKREAFLMKNLKQLREQILDNPQSALYGKLEVFISDNGRSLKREEIETPGIRLFPNRNAGGSGGFGRGMLEILKCRQQHGLTHMIFMDDDVVIEPDAFVRTFGFLTLLKEEYRNTVMAGAMLRMDLPYVLHEAGAVWNGVYPAAEGQGDDLRKRASLLRLAEHRRLTNAYAAWWYACYPLNVVEKAGLPLPLFLHMDDIEYGMRTNCGVMTLNGICVWHEPFEHKRSSTLAYYDTRNQLLVNSLYRPEDGFRKAAGTLFARMAALMLRYRYRDVKLLCEGIRDFGAGIRTFSEDDPEKKNLALIQKGYQPQQIDMLEHISSRELIDIKDQIGAYQKPTEPGEIYGIGKCGSGKRFRRRYLLSLNGWLFPAKGDRIYAYSMGVSPWELYRKKRILLFDPDSGKGILLQKSYLRAVRCLWLYTRTIVWLKLRYRRVCREYRDGIRELTKRGNWERYLGLGKDDHK